MASKREAVLEALLARLKPALLGTTRRDDGSEQQIPKSGTGALVTIEDGTTSGTALLSPLSYDIQHDVPISIEAASRADMDNAAQAVASIVQGDQTMGGIVDWLTVDAFDAAADQPEGERNVPMPRVFTGSLSVTLFYNAPSVAG
jgi:hypothetical protein